jgi:hypothetical protein
MNLEEINKIRAELNYPPLNMPKISGYVIGCHCDGCKQMDIDRHNAIRELERNTRSEPNFGSDGWQTWHDAELERIEAEQRARDKEDWSKAQQLDASWTDFPFMTAWAIWFLGWALPLVGAVSLWQTAYHTSNMACFVLWWLSMLLLSLISAMVTRYGHKHLGWWGTAPYNGVDRTDQAIAEANKQYWAGADAKNGLHRSPGLDSGEEKPTDEFALDRGLLGEFSGSDLPYDPEWATPLYHGGRELEPHRIKRGWSVKVSFKRED